MHLLYIHSNAITNPKANLIQVIQMCQAFSKSGIEVTLAVPSIGSLTIDLNEFVKEHYGFEPLFRIKTYQEWKYRLRESLYFEVSDLLKEVKPDCCITRMIWAAIRCVQSNIPTMYESHNATMRQRWWILDKLEKFLLVRISKDKSFLKLITISENLRKYWEEKKIACDKLLSIHDGFAADMFNENYYKDKIRTKLSLPYDQQIVTYTGSLYENRNVEIIFKLAELYKDVFFLMVGGPIGTAKALEKKRRNRGLKNLRIEGPVLFYQVPRYLFASDILLAIWSSKVPTINYCSPLKLFEYMASGRLIVAQDFPTIREVLKDGHTAIIVKPDSLDALSDGLSRALNNKNNIIGTNARKVAFTKYTWENRARTIIQNINF